MKSAASGNENSGIYQTKGFVRRIFDADAQKVGMPIKTSLSY